MNTIAHPPVDRVVLAIDPSDTQHAWCVVDEGLNIYGFGRDFATAPTAILRMSNETWIEMIASYGMPVGREVFETCLNIGELAMQMPHAKLITRQQVKLGICYSPRATDATIRAALMDRFGGKASVKKGGKLYGIAADVWAALAIAVAVLTAPPGQPIDIYRRNRDTL